VARLQVILRDALAILRFQPVGKIAVLNLACGRADETGALAAALAPAEIGHYVGIDLRSDTIAEATKRWGLPDGVIEFRIGDASSIDRMRELPEFDIIFIRHQNYWFDPVTWDRLLGNALDALAPEGLLACTSYFDGEHELLKASLATRGARVLWDVAHPGARPLTDAPGKSVDRRLAIFSQGTGKRH
jgi:trans-aconitate methyltransferase